jgi:C-terminal processing protease CtpA/Prc
MTPMERPFEGDTSGLKLVAEKPDWKKIRVAAVRPGSPAVEAGVETGDILLMIDGKTPPPLYSLTKLLDAHLGTSVRVTVLRSGKTQTMTIYLRRLIYRQRGCEPGSDHPLESSPRRQRWAQVPVNAAFPRHYQD